MTPQAAITHRKFHARLQLSASRTRRRTLRPFALPLCLALLFISLIGFASAETIVGMGGSSSSVRSFSDVSFNQGNTFTAFPNSTGGVRVAGGDVNHDGVGDFIVGSGPGSSQVKVIDGRTNTLLWSFEAYPGFLGGVFVAAGDVNGDGFADIITGTGDSTAQVKVFSGQNNAVLASFFAFSTSTSGVRVASGDVNGDGRADIIAGAGADAPVVKIFDGPTQAVLTSFNAYPGVSGGVFVAAGDIDGDGLAEVITGTNSGVAHVKVFKSLTQELLRSFFAFGGSSSGGVRVASGDVTGDGIDDILVGSGPGSAAVQAYDGDTNALVAAFTAFQNSSDGVFVGYRSLGVPEIASVVSRKMHGAQGSFDLALPVSGNAGVECRSGGRTKAYQLVITFAKPVTYRRASVTAGEGSVASTSGSGTTTVTVDLLGVSNEQTISVQLAAVNDGMFTADLAVQMALLLGDVNHNGVVNASDVSQVKGQAGQTPGLSNFTADLDANGAITASDIGFVKSQSGTHLP